jgi:hypothetical protein
MTLPPIPLGNALDGSSGPPDYKPHFGHHERYMFGAHYFFEVSTVSISRYPMSLKGWSAKCLNWSIVTRAHAPRQLSVCSP